MATLFTYQKKVQRLLRDQRQQLINPADLVEYINEARRMVAIHAQCIRVVPPISGQVIQITVTSPGSGYSSSPTVSISAPDFPGGQKLTPLGAQATATATVVGGAISSINVVYGGSGYFQPIVTITDTTGTGATATATVSPIQTTQNGQEEYRFADVDLSTFPGVKEILNVRLVTTIYAQIRYPVIATSFDDYKANIANFPLQFTFVPWFTGQLGQGASGSLFMYPVPNGIYQQEWDCICLPDDLVNNNSPEAIPDPWTEAVPYFALHLAYNELQNTEKAQYYLQLYLQYLRTYSVGARPGMTFQRSWARGTY